jgi:hypothetical protein
LVIPPIRQADGQTGFGWVTPDGRPASLPDLVAAEAAHAGLVPTADAAMIVRAAGALDLARANGQRVYRS